MAQSLRLTGSPHDLVLLLDEANAADVDAHSAVLRAHFDAVKRVPPVSNPYNVKGFTKLHAWQLTEYERVVYIDADTLVLGGLDHLFERPEVSAVPDVYMSGKFNSGLLVIKPSKVGRRGRGRWGGWRARARTFKVPQREGKREGERGWGSLRGSSLGIRSMWQAGWHSQRLSACLQSCIVMTY